MSQAEIEAMRDGLARAVEHMRRTIDFTPMAAAMSRARLKHAVDRMDDQTALTLDRILTAEIARFTATGGAARDE